jgi:hypothetical protein
MSRVPYPLELVGDADWQLAARTVWEALSALDDEQGDTELDMSCSAIVLRAQAGLVQLADPDPLVAARAFVDLRGSVDSVVALFSIAMRPEVAGFRTSKQSAKGLTSCPRS